MFFSSKKRINIEDFCVRLETAVIDNPVKLLSVFLKNKSTHGDNIKRKLNYQVETNHKAAPSLIVIAWIALVENDDMAFPSYLKKLSSLKEYDIEQTLLAINMSFQILQENENTKTISSLEQSRTCLLLAIKHDPVKWFSLYIDDKITSDDVKCKLLQKISDKHNREHRTLVALMLIGLNQQDKNLYAESHMKQLISLEGHMSNGLPPSVNIFFSLLLEKSKNISKVIELKNDCISLVINSQQKPLCLFPLFLKHIKTHDQLIKIKLLQQIHNNPKNYHAVIVLMLIDLSCHDEEKATRRLRLLMEHDVCNKHMPLSVITFFKEAKQQKNLLLWQTTVSYQEKVSNLQEKIAAVTPVATL